MTILEVLNESYNKEASDITNKIFSYVESNNTSINIGELFGLKNKDVKVNVIKTLDKDFRAYVDFNMEAEFPNVPIIITINKNPIKKFLKSSLLHEVNHIINHIKSNGKTSINIFRTKKKIKNHKSISDISYSKTNIDYMKDSEEMNSYYNQFVSSLKGKKFSNVSDIKDYLLKYFKNNQGMDNIINYYLEENKEIKKYFLKRFYQDGYLGK